MPDVKVNTPDSFTSFNKRNAGLGVKVLLTVRLFKLKVPEPDKY